MSKLLSALKEEIVRIARKEIRAETDALRKACSRHRTEIAALKRKLAGVEKPLRKSALAAAAAPSAEAGTNGSLRFRADGLRGHRERLGLTAREMASLLDVSVQTLANWESRKTKPRAAQMERIAAVRKLGKRDVAKQVEAARN